MKVSFTTLLFAAAAVVSAQEPSAEKPSAGAPSGPSDGEPKGHSMSGAAMEAMAMAFPSSSQVSSPGHGGNNPVSYGSEDHTSDEEDHSNPLEDDHGPDNAFDNFGHRPAPHSVSDIGAPTTSAPTTSKSDVALANSSVPSNSSTASASWSSKLLVSDALPAHATGSPQNVTSSGWYTNASSIATSTAIPKGTGASSFIGTAASSGSPQNVTSSGYYTNTSSVVAPTTVPKGTGASSIIGTAVSSGVAAPTGGSAAPSGGFAMPSFKIPTDHGKMPFWMNWTEMMHGPPSGPPSRPSGTAVLPSGTAASSQPVASESAAANSTAPIKTHLGFPSGAASSEAAAVSASSSPVATSAPAEQTVFVTVHDTISVTTTTTVDAKPSSHAASSAHAKPTGEKAELYGDNFKRGDALAPVESGPPASTTTVAPGTPTDPDPDSACAQLEEDGITQNSHAPCHYHHATGDPIAGAAKPLGMLGGLIPRTVGKLPGKSALDLTDGLDIIPRQAPEEDDAAPPAPQEQAQPTGVIPTEAQAQMTGLPSTFATSLLPAATAKGFHPKHGTDGALIL